MKQFRRCYCNVLFFKKSRKYNEELLESYSGRILGATTFRLSTEISLIDSTAPYKTNIFIKKCFEIYSAIFEYDPMLGENMLGYEDVLVRITKLLDQIDKMDFEDSVIDVYSVLLKKSRNFTDSMAMLVGYFPVIFEKNHYNIEIFFDFIINAISFGEKNLTYDHEESLHIISVILARSLDYFTQGEATPHLAYQQLCKSCFLIQILVQKLNKSEIAKDIPLIVDSTIRLYNKMKMNELEGKGIGYSPK